MTLSIVTINYNNLEGLRKTIASVLSQTWHDYEWIIIDGGSTDGSRKLIEQTAEKLNSSDFNPLSFWCSEPDKGIYNAMNKGIEHCMGEYVNFMNSGDCFYEDTTLEKLFTEQKHVDVIYGDTYIDKGEASYIKKGMNPITFFGFLCKKDICHQSSFIKAHILKEKGYDETYRICADYARWIEMTLNGVSFEHIPQIICRFDSTGISNTLQQLTDKEYDTVINTLIPPTILLPLQDYLHEREILYNPYIFKTTEIIKHGGMTARVLKFFIRTVKFIEKFK